MAKKKAEKKGNKVTETEKADSATAVAEKEKPSKEEKAKAKAAEVEKMKARRKELQTQMAEVVKSHEGDYIAAIESEEGAAINAELSQISAKLTKKKRKSKTQDPEVAKAIDEATEQIKEKIEGFTTKLHDYVKKQWPKLGENEILPILSFKLKNTRRSRSNDSSRNVRIVHKSKEGKRLKTFSEYSHPSMDDLLATFPEVKDKIIEVVGPGEGQSMADKRRKLFESINFDTNTPVLTLPALPDHEAEELHEETTICLQW